MLKKCLTMLALCALLTMTAALSGCSDRVSTQTGEGTKQAGGTEPSAASGALPKTSDSEPVSDETEQMEAADGNTACKRIPNLTTPVSAANKADYDFTPKAMDYLEQIGRHLEACKGGDAHEAEVRQLGDWIVQELKQAGYHEAQIEQQSFVYADYMGAQKDGRNIIVTVEGEDPSRQIIAGAHYDGDGAGDNGSGVALLLANAAGLIEQKPRYTVKYIFFDAEEVGCEGSNFYSRQMTQAEVSATLYMINLDSLAFGDYCNLYGGDVVNITDEATGQDDRIEAYTFAADSAQKLGFQVMRTEDLDGYFKTHGTGPEIEANTLYTNPWTADNPPPVNYAVPSPATLPASDHIGFMERDIEYIYFEATNWFAEGENDDVEASSYTGYVETYDYSLGAHGMFMNTEHDTWENLNKLFPGRAEAHFRLYSPLLSALLLAG